MSLDPKLNEADPDQVPWTNTGRVRTTPSPEAWPTILLVDDDEAVRKLWHNIFERHQYNLLEAADGAEALLLSELHGGGIDLVITDVQMPRLNGWQLASQLHQQRPETAFLFISGYAPSINFEEFLPAAQKAFLAKPVALPSLLVQVRQLLVQKCPSKVSTMPTSRL